MVLTLPATTRAVVFHAPADIRLERVPVRPPGPGEALVRIRACGLCHGETMAWYMQRKAPAPLGHETVGEVVAAGSGVPVSVGQRVFVHHHAPCLQCRACRRGDYVHCRTWRRHGLTPGGLSEYALASPEVAAADLLPLPPSLSDDTAVFVEPLACVVKALRRARLRAGDRVAVIGLGVMGLLHVMLARSREEVERVVGVDLLPERLEIARTVGADVVIAAGAHTAEQVREATDGGADVVVVTPASADALREGFASVAPGGRLIVFAPLPPEEVFALPVHDMYFREIEIVPSYSAGPEETREAVRHLQDGLPVATLVSHRLPLDQAAHGYRMVAEGRALKVVVYP